MTGDATDSYRRMLLDYALCLGIALFIFLLMLALFALLATGGEALEWHA